MTAASPLNPSHTPEAQGPAEAVEEGGEGGGGLGGAGEAALEAGEVAGGGADDEQAGVVGVGVVIVLPPLRW